MKTYIFTDCKTGETYTLTCYPYEVNSIELKNEVFRTWVIGRIVKRSEVERQDDK